MSSVCRSFATPPEKEMLRALAAFIETRSDAAREEVVSIFSKLVAVAYVAGGKAAAKQVKHVEPLGLTGLDPVLDRLALTLNKTFDSLSGELTWIINQGIKNRKTYTQVARELTAAIRGGWGNTITFDRVGKVRRYVHVNPDGTLRWAEKTISRKITLPADTYANTLSRTNMKAAYARGHLQRYKESGRKGWVYLSVADERSRPHHIALHGRVFIFGTEEEEMALEIMEEPNCRCRPKAWFDDPDLDDDPALYEQERKGWAQKAIDELPEGQKDGQPAKFLEKMVAG